MVNSVTIQKYVILQIVIIANHSLMTPKMLLQEFAREILPNSKCFQPILCIQEKYVMTEEQSIVVTQHTSLAEHSDVKGSAKEVSAYPLLTVIQITIVILL